MRCYGLDSAYLRTVADRIGPEPAAVAEDLEATPADAWSWAFRDREDNKGGKRIGSPKPTPPPTQPDSRENRNCKINGRG